MAEAEAEDAAAGGPRGGHGGGGGGGGWGGSGDKPKLRDAGALDWHGYETRFARLRHGGAGKKGEGDGKGEAFYETMRVILTTKTQCLIGYLRFEPGVEGTKGAAEELLAQFVPLGDE